MLKTVLTDVGVRALQAPDQGQLTVWDARSPLGVRVSQGGAKTFIVLTGPGQRRTIGRAGIVSLSNARTKAKRILAEKTLGIAEKPTTIKFEAAKDLFIENHYRDKKPRVKKEAKRHLNKHFRKFNARPLSEITDAEIARELDKLAATPGEQLHAFRILRTFFKWTTRPPRRFIRHSPLEGYEPPSKDGTNDRILSQEELARVWNAAEGMFGAIVRLLILTVTRKMEIGSLRWDWLDGDILTIPGTARKNGKPLSIPLGELALSIINDQPKRNAYVFPSRLDREAHIHDGSFAKLKKELDHRSGVANYGLHSLRKTAATMIAHSGTPPHVLQAVLGHLDGPVTELQALYNKYSYLEEKREALLAWEKKIHSLCPGAL